MNEKKKLLLFQSIVLWRQQARLILVLGAHIITLSGRDTLAPNGEHVPSRVPKEIFQTTTFRV